MGLSSTTNRTSAVGDGSSTVFSFPYEFFSASDLLVFMYDSGSSIIQPQVLNTNYTVSGGQNVNGIFPNGGNVIMTSAVPVGFQLITVRSPNPVQNYVLLQNGQINALALTQQFDYLTALVQRLQDEVSRSLILPDGLGTRNGVQFSQVLPSSVNLQSSASQVLAINSGASGWSLVVVPGVGSLIPVSQGGTGQGSPLVDGAVIYAVNSSLMAPTSQGTAGQALLSGGASAPSWGSISIGSGAVTAGSIQGILGLYQGGTNTGSSYSYPVNSVIVASGTAANQGFVGTAVATPGTPLVANGSSIPSFQALPLSGPGVSGILPQGNGGTGASFFPSSGGVIFGSGLLSVFASTLGGGTDQPLVGNTGGGPSFKAINLASGSSVTGTLAISLGGTGQISAGAAFQALSPTTTFGDIIYSGSANIATRLAANTPGLVLSTNGPGAAPSWVATATGSSLTNPMTTLGDGIYGGAAGVATRFVGSVSNSTMVHVQTASSGVSTAPVWALPPGNVFWSGFYPANQTNFWTNSSTAGYSQFKITGTIPSPTTITSGGGFVVSLETLSRPGVSFVAPRTGVLKVSTQFSYYSGAGGNSLWAAKLNESTLGLDLAFSSGGVTNGTTPSQVVQVPMEGMFQTVAGTTYNIAILTVNSNSSVQFIGDFSNAGAQVSFQLHYTS